MLNWQSKLGFLLGVSAADQAARKGQRHWRIHGTRRDGCRLTRSVLINVTLERQTVEYLNKFEAAVRRHPEIQECYLMTGGSGLLPTGGGTQCCRVRADPEGDPLDASRCLTYPFQLFDQKRACEPAEGLALICALPR